MDPSVSGFTVRINHVSMVYSSSPLQHSLVPHVEKNGTRLLLLIHTLMLHAYLFHAGKLTRDRSQKLLDSKPAGSYLVRLSTKIWGYTVSVQCM